jgi:hypothetical protein
MQNVVNGPVVSNLRLAVGASVPSMQLVSVTGDDFTAPVLTTLDFASAEEALRTLAPRGGGVDRINGRATRSAVSAMLLRTAASTGTCLVREIIYRLVQTGAAGLQASVRLKAAARVTYTFDTSDAASAVLPRDVPSEAATRAAAVAAQIGAAVAWMWPTSVVVEDLGVAGPSSGFGWQGENGVPAMAHQYDMGSSSGWARSLVVPTSGITSHGVLPVHWTWS